MATSPLDYIPKIKTGPNAGGLPPALLKQTATSLAGALRGELPQDVQDLLRQQAAEYGVASGAGGSQYAAYAGLRNLGLTSLDRIKGAESILGNQFITPGQSQQLALDAGKTRAGIAQNQFELEQRGEIERNRLAQDQTQFTRGQELSREELAQRASLASQSESGANYRASLGLGGGSSGSRGGRTGGFTGGGSVGGIATTPGFYEDPNNTPIIATGSSGWQPSTFDYGYNNASVVSGVPYDSAYDDGYGGYDFSEQDLYDYGY